jgi:hypothetical protein
MKVRWMLVSLLCMALVPMAALALPRSVNSATVPQDAPHDRDDHHDMDHHDGDHHGMDRDHDWDHDPRFSGRKPAYRNGFRDGFQDGRNDREAGRRWHYGSGYKHSDHGYQGEFGDRNEYRREYRHGYEEAYREGYGERH